MYAQSPESMKGMLTGLFYFVFGIFNGGSSFLYYAFLRHMYHWKITTYYWVLLGFSLFGLVIYIIAACIYVNRRRPTSETEEAEETRLFYNNISIP